MGWLELERTKDTSATLTLLKEALAAHLMGGVEALKHTVELDVKQRTVPAGLPSRRLRQFLLLEFLQLHLLLCLLRKPLQLAAPQTPILISVAPNSAIKYAHQAIAAARTGIAVSS